jgi:hypothetical protein
MEPLPEGPSGPVREPGLQQRLEALEQAIRRLTDTNSWRRLLDGHVPAGECVAVLADPAIVSLEALGRPVVCVPPDAEGGASGVARLEARQLEGVRFVFVPEVSRQEAEQDTYLSEHLRASFRAVGSDPEVGNVFEAASQSAGKETPPLGELIDSLGLRDRLTPILDWTSHGMAQSLPGHPLFRPVAPGAGLLPYLDHTIDVVIVDDVERLDEGARVAANAAVLVSSEGDAGAIPVETRRARAAPVRGTAPVPIVVAADADDEWVERVADVLMRRAGLEVRAAAEPTAEIFRTGSPAVVVAERGVLPLPGCIEAAERLLAANERLGGVAVKLFDANGELEAAGGAAFADGSVEPIAKGAPPSAPWHEYVRPVPTAVGLMVLRSAAARQCAPDRGGAFDLAALSARLWSSGCELRYQPHAAAVSVLPRRRAGADAWSHEREGLPERPAELTHASWRALLASEVVGAVR